MRIALAQINPTVGDLAGNARIIIDALKRARDERAELVVFPELSLCGYPPKDLLLQDGFIRANVKTAKEIGEGHTAGMTVVFGTATPADEVSLEAANAGKTPPRIANSLLVYRDGQFVEFYDKRLLPTYDVFDENRYFTPGDRAVMIEVGGVQVGLAICEDLWRGEDMGFSSRYAHVPDPVTELVRAGAKVVVAPYASPFVLWKGKRHRELVSSHARRHGVYVVSVNQVGGNDDLIFSGHSAVYGPNGKLVAAAQGFREDLLVVDLADSQSLSGPEASDTEELEDPRIVASAEELLFDALVLGVRDYCRKTGFKSAVLGISGGIDSAVTAAIGVAALGAANITGIMMPGRYSSEHSQADAIDLARRLKIQTCIAPIEPPMKGFAESVNEMFARQRLPMLGQAKPDITEENLQSRSRGTLLMAFSNRTGAIVLTTGNKSELAVGYCTLYGDMNGGLAVLSDVIKQNVYRLAEWMNEHYASRGFELPPIPERSITKAPSAELRPDQTDQDTLPPYDVLDEIVQRAVEGRQGAEGIARETGFELEMVQRIVGLINASEYKRRQAAIGLKVTGVAFGSGRRMPVAQGWRGD